MMLNHFNTEIIRPNDTSNGNYTSTPRMRILSPTILAPSTLLAESTMSNKAYKVILVMKRYWWYFFSLLIYHLVSWARLTFFLCLSNNLGPSLVHDTFVLGLS